MSRPSDPSTPSLDDPLAEQVRREHERKLIEILGLPAIELTILASKQLADGVATPIAHGLGRVPTFASNSFIRGASSTGRIDEVSRDDRFLTLKATGWGATITIDVAVM